MVVLFAIESRSSQDSLCYIHENSPLSQGATSSHDWRCALIYVILTRGLHSLWSRGCIRLIRAPHFNQPAALAGLSCSATASCRWATSPGGDHPVPTAHRWPCRLYRRVGITPLPRVPYRAVCPHRDLTRTARFVADASGLTTLDLMHAPQSSPAFSLRSEVSMLPAPWHTRPLRSSWHVG